MTPSGASVGQLMHYGQGVRDGRFARFDHGWSGNLRRYNSRRPPVYQLNRIDSPVVLHYARNDMLASKTDVIELANQLRHSHLEEVSDPKFSYVDFLWARNAKSLVYNKIVRNFIRADAGGNFLVLN